MSEGTATTVAETPFVSRFKGPFRFDDRNKTILMASEKGGEVFVLDMRGWQYLVRRDRASLGLDKREAFRQCDEFGFRIATALNQYGHHDRRVTKLLEAITAMQFKLDCMVENVEHAIGCFDAADVEGLTDALSSAYAGEPGALRDLVERRILHAKGYLQAALHGARDQPTQHDPDTLKSCPCCKSTADYHRINNGMLNQGLWFVQCGNQNCGISTMLIIPIEEVAAKKMLRDIWNARAR